MTTKILKVYGGCYDGIYRVIVAAFTAVEAYRLMIKCRATTSSSGTWRKLTCETGNTEENAVARAEPGVVFRRKVNARDHFLKMKQ